MEDLKAIKKRVWIGVIGGGANVSHQLKLFAYWLSGCQGNRARLQHFVGMPH